MPVAAKVADAILEHQLDLFRLEAGTRTKVIRLLNQLQAELSAQLQAQDLTAFSKARLQALLRQSTESIDAYYLRIQEQLAPTLEGIARTQASHLVKVLPGMALPTETFFARLVGSLLIHGAPSATWWDRQAKNTTFKFANVVRFGIASGQTNEQIVRSITGSVKLGIPGVMNVSRANARSLVHTSVQTVANSARLETFKQNGDLVKGVRQLSTFDSHTTEQCLAYDGAEWDLDGNPINGTVLPFVTAGGSPDGVPRHWGCRSVLVPITATFRDLGIDMDELPPVKRPRAKGAKNMDDWLDRRSVKELDKLLGPGRADLYRRGVITREQLLDFSGNPLTLAQLEAKYGP